MRVVTLALLLSLIAGFSATGYSQQTWWAGVKGGINIPNLTSSNNTPVSNGFKSRLDADASIFTELSLTRRFSVQAQLEYSAQGGKKNGSQAFTVPPEYQPLFPVGQAPDFLYANYKSEAKLNYLMLPLQAKYYFYAPRHWRAYLAAGPFVSYLLNAKNITSGASLVYLDAAQSQPIVTETQSFNNSENISSHLHRFNTGIAGNIGLSYMLGNNAFFAEAGGNFGLIDIQKDNTDGKNKTGAALFSLGYQHRL